MYVLARRMFGLHDLLAFDSGSDALEAFHSSPPEQEPVLMSVLISYNPISKEGIL